MTAEAAPIKCDGRESAGLPTLSICESVGLPALSIRESDGLPADSQPAHFIGAASEERPLRGLELAVSGWAAWNQMTLGRHGRTTSKAQQ